MKKLFIVLLAGVAACTPAKKESPAETTAATEAPAAPADMLEAPAFKEKLADPNIVLLDVRTPEEVAQGVIPGAVNIDFNAPDFSDKVAALDKSKTYLLYCKAGGRSTKAQEQMKDLGFEQVYNLKGGYMSWKEQGMETRTP